MFVAVRVVSHLKAMVMLPFYIDDIVMRMLRSDNYSCSAHTMQVHTMPISSAYSAYFVNFMLNNYMRATNYISL